jgi:predicted site-specific integrase-resolvase
VFNVFDKRSAAQALGISIETIDKYRKRGKLPFRQIGDRIIFTEGDLTAFLDLCAVPATVIPTKREKLEMVKAAGGRHEDAHGHS